MKRGTRLAATACAAWRSLIVGMCATAALALTAQAFGFTLVDPGAFSPGAAKITFEDMPGDFSALPPGYGSGSGISFTAGTESGTYASYGSSLVSAAGAIGLGAVGATWGCNGVCGTGFTLSNPRVRIGGFVGSNVAVSVTITAFRGGVTLGSQVVILAPNVFGFFGFEDAGGIDRVEIGDNTDCSGCVHQLDNVLIDSAAVPPAQSATAVPTLSQWGTIVLSALLALAAVFALRRRRH